MTKYEPLMLVPDTSRIKISHWGEHILGKSSILQKHESFMAPKPNNSVLIIYSLGFHKMCALHVFCR